MVNKEYKEYKEYKKYKEDKEYATSWIMSVSSCADGACPNCVITSLNSSLSIVPLWFWNTGLFIVFTT